MKSQTIQADAKIKNAKNIKTRNVLVGWATEDSNINVPGSTKVMSIADLFGLIKFYAFSF